MCWFWGSVGIWIIHIMAYCARQCRQCRQYLQVDTAIDRIQCSMGQWNKNNLYQWPCSHNTLFKNLSTQKDVYKLKHKITWQLLFLSVHNCIDDTPTTPKCGLASHWNSHTIAELGSINLNQIGICHMICMSDYSYHPGLWPLVSGTITTGQGGASTTMHWGTCCFPYSKHQTGTLLVSKLKGWKSFPNSKT